MSSARKAAKDLRAAKAAVAPSAQHGALADTAVKHARVNVIA